MGVLHDIYGPFVYLCRSIDSVIGLVLRVSKNFGFNRYL